MIQHYYNSYTLAMQYILWHVIYIYVICIYIYIHGRRPGAEFGGTKKFFRGPISGKMSIFRVKISDDLFFSHRLGSSDFPFFSHIFRMFTMLNVVYDHFLTRKPPFFTLFILSRTSDNTASQNIGGNNAWAAPPPKIWGGTVPPV